MSKVCHVVVERESVGQARHIPLTVVAVDHRPV
jgi:hypothetical protein